MGVISEGVDLLKLVNKAQNADLYKELGEWIDKVTELQKENEQIKAERDRLREEVRFKAALERVNGHTFVQGDDEEICPSCAAVESRLVYLQRLPSKRPPGVKATCPACKLEMDQNIPYNRELASKNK